MPLFSRFLTAHACNTLSVGIQIVLVSWLAVGILRLPASQVGWVQSAVLIPNIVVLLLAGRWVEHCNPVKVLRLVNVLLALVHLGFFGLLLQQAQSLFSLVIYAVLLGTCNALIQNARETLLGRLSEEQGLQRNVSMVTLVQFGAQALGVGLTLLMQWVNVAALVALQAGLCVLAAIFYSSASLKQAGIHPGQASVARGFRVALAAINQIKALRTVLLIVAFNGLMHMGLFIVLLPIMSTERLGFSVAAYTTLQLTFIFGSVVVSARLMFGKPVQFPGQHVLFAAVYSGVIGLALAAGPKPSGLYLLIFCWGVVAGGSANLCRVVVQSLAPEAMRARTMSLYQTALFGMAPIGALLAGYLVHMGGLELALKTMAYASFGLFAVAMLQKDLWAFSVQNSEQTR